MPDPKIYGWKIVFSNDRMGFRRTVDVEGPTMTWAIDAAFSALEDTYSKTIDEFYAVEASRGREVGT